MEKFAELGEEAIGNKRVEDKAGGGWGWGRANDEAVAFNMKDEIPVPLGPTWLSWMAC